MAETGAADGGWLAATARRWRLDEGAALAALGGAVLLFQVATLPAITLLGSLMLIGAGLVQRTLRLRLLGWVLLGFGWTGLHAGWALQVWLPEQTAATDVRLEVIILDLPEPSDDAVRFAARVVSAPPELSAVQGRRLQLAWYAEPPPALQPGERWLLDLRLRRPRGLANPGGFDFERHALQQGIVATGYVRSPHTAQRLSPGGGVDALRQRLSRELQEQAGEGSARFLRGLSVGDTTALSDDDWALLRATGLSHLLAISGLHIGLVAGFAALLMRLPYALWPGLGLRLPLPQAAAAAALTAAVGYSALAGFGLPTIRTLVMLAAALLAVLVRRRASLPQGLALAAMLLLIADPLSTLSAGFWLSFVGVAWLLMCLPGELPRGRWWVALLRAQGVMAVGLLPLGILFFGQASLVGVGLNLLAVPWVNLVVVPLTLLGTALLSWPALAAPVLAAADAAMAGMLALARWAAGADWAQTFWPTPDLAAMLVAMIGVLWLLLPRAVPGKLLAAVLLLPLLWPRSDRLALGEFDLQLLDVGQGLAILVSTREHHLLYDAGPRLRSGTDLGERVVMPSLRAAGVTLDRVLISHADSDHAGGLHSVLGFAGAVEVVSGEPRRLGRGQTCGAAPGWRWDGVDFELLHPPAAFPELGNQSSCVLRIRGAAGRALLPGDIDALIEQRLLREHGDALSAEVLVAPHHGSRSSSSDDLLRAVAPQQVLISAGFGNRFGHPDPTVLDRYSSAGAAVHNTADSGAISLRVGGDGIRVIRWREAQPRFWRSRPVPLAGQPR